MQAVNFPFIKSIIFEELNCPNDEFLNRRIKSEFLMFLNCRKWRYMNLIRHDTEENPYCEIKLQENILQVKANRELIKIFLDVMKKFENINFGDGVEIESVNFSRSKIFADKFHSKKWSKIFN